MFDTVFSHNITNLTKRELRKLRRPKPVLQRCTGRCGYIQLRWSGQKQLSTFCCNKPMMELKKSVETT